MNDREALLKTLRAQASKEEAARATAKVAKVAWKDALEEQKAARDLLADQVKQARSEMDRANLVLGDAVHAKNRIRAEFTPLALQKKEAKAGAAYRVLAQRATVLARDVVKMRDALKLRDRRSGSLPPDKDTKKREAERVVYLESVAADAAKAAAGSKAIWAKACKELEDACAQTA